MNEEIETEIEALEAIYMDEFTQVSTSPVEIEIKLLPNLDCDENNVALHLCIKYSPNYPDEIPEVSLRPIQGLSKADCQELQQSLITLAEENIGMAMVFDLATQAREYMNEKNTKEDEKIVEIEEEVIEIKGTPVTKDTFDEWKARVQDKLMAENAIVKLSVEAAKKAGERLTGRQLFESDPTLGIEESEGDTTEENETNETIEQNSETTNDIDWELFEDDGLDELDDE